MKKVIIYTSFALLLLLVAAIGCTKQDNSKNMSQSKGTDSKTVMSSTLPAGTTVYQSGYINSSSAAAKADMSINVSSSSGITITRSVNSSSGSMSSRFFNATNVSMTLSGGQLNFNIPTISGKSYWLVPFDPDIDPKRLVGPDPGRTVICFCGPSGSYGPSSGCVLEIINGRYECNKTVNSHCSDCMLYDGAPSPTVEYYDEVNDTYMITAPSMLIEVQNSQTLTVDGDQLNP